MPQRRNALDLLSMPTPDPRGSLAHLLFRLEELKDAIVRLQEELQDLGALCVASVADTLANLVTDASYAQAFWHAVHQGCDFNN